MNDDATVAMPQQPPPGPPTSSSPSRISVISPLDEGRFVPGAMLAGRYRVIALLGRGGMGEVYRATDLALAQSVALKILPEEAAANEHLLERFHNEVRIARQVSHPNVCRVYDIGEADGMPFLSMEYVDGEDLASLLQRIGRLPTTKALDIARKLCAGLAAAHERGVIHRDLKPQNIMLNKRGEVVIMDFGLAAVADELQGPEARNGTPAYMSPEQLRGDSVTAKSDLYALGLIFYELFTGKRAYEATSLAELIRLQETGRPPSLTSIASDADPEVEKVILRCLRVDPAARPANALSIAAALPGGDPLAAALAAGETPSPELVAASGQTRGFALRYAVPCLVFVLVSLLVLPFILQPLSLLALAPMPLPPDVLEHKAREIAAGFGYAEKPTDWTGWFATNPGLLLFLKDRPGAKNWRQWFTAESPVLYLYRQSPEYLWSPPDGQITMERPAPTNAGMLRVSLDSRGLLRRFQAVPPRFDPPSAPKPAVAPADLFRLAGLDLAQFHESPPLYTPPLAFDQRQAWTGVYPGLPQTNVTVETATWQGKLTSFLVVWPWDLPAPTRTVQQHINWFGVFALALYSTFLFCGLFYAVRNLRLGRGDRKGAFRLAAAGFLIYLAGGIAEVHVIPDGDRMIAYAIENLSLGLGICFLLWLLYMALEPAVRARWPHSLISWNRLLAGQFRDPMLGSHMLLGVTAGMGLACLFVWRTYVLIDRGGTPLADDFDVLLGTRAVSARLANLLFTALLAGAASFFLLSGLRGLLRYDWLTAMAGALLLTLQEQSVRNSRHIALDFPIYMVVFALLCLMLLRLGLVPAILCVFTANTAVKIPVGSDVFAWFHPAAVLLISILASIAIYSFWRSQAEVPR